MPLLHWKTRESNLEDCKEASSPEVNQYFNIQTSHHMVWLKFDLFSYQFFRHFAVCCCVFSWKSSLILFCGFLKRILCSNLSKI